jgi:hypothetical protein
MDLSAPRFELPTDEQGEFDNLAVLGQVGRRCAAAAVRSEAQDERRSREQSLRARQIKRLQISEAQSSNQSDHSRPNVG